MKSVLILFVFLLLNNCSLNKDSKFWTEDVDKKIDNKKKLSKILKKSDDITTMTLDEYKIYIDDYTKKSKYPDITQ
jgi:cell division protein FtsI/penicillin-binding protein 2